uniref:Uncharacterized protein LOC117357718 n=1 Tax=Geotrypetes seraphini TaxID=260995 RepID=A0A6P8R3M4_GEOSA|nr:uncharacterized protein LOC117357718 [Geotrypetes seraphini]XP_033794589.1 uncharacterized protein LOC117357718 [Geotrypetes seraphini]
MPTWSEELERCNRTRLGETRRLRCLVSHSRTLPCLRRSVVLRFTPRQGQKKVEPVRDTPPPTQQRADSSSGWRAKKAFLPTLLQSESIMHQDAAVSLVTKENTAESTGTFTEGLEKVVLPMQRPKVFNMETLWEAISSLQLSLGFQIQQLSSRNTTVLSENLDIKNKLSSLETKMEEYDSRLKVVKTKALTWVKDSGNLHFKIEMLENATKKCNLRIINFPKVFPVSAQDMFKKYLTEVLKVPETSYSPLSKIYYLPRRIQSQNPNQQNLSSDSLDLTNFLERSETEAQVTAALLVQFAIDSDRKWMLKLFLQI